MSNTEVALGTFAIILSVVFGFLSVFCFYGRTVHYRKEEIRKAFSNVRKLAVIAIALLNFIYSMVYVEGYKYLRFEIIELVKPVAYHLLVYVLINGISSLLLMLAVITKNTYIIFIYLAFVIQWFGMIVIIANEIMFTSYVANIICASILLVCLTPFIFIIPPQLKQGINYVDKKKFENMNNDEVIAFNSAHPDLHQSDK
jgi:hypothetical protein